MEIKTRRLYIRNLRPTDWLQMKNIFVDFNNSKYAIYDTPLPMDDKNIKELTGKFAESNLFYAILRQDCPEMLGYVCFHKNEDKYDLGYCFHSKNHGEGYALESCQALMEYLQKQYAVKIFTAGTAMENTPSCNLLSKLGFECKSTEILSFHKDSLGNEIRFQGGDFVCLVGLVLNES